MYSEEIANYLENRHCTLLPEELMFITNISESPQINHVKFVDDHYKMSTNDGYDFEFGYVHKDPVEPPKVKVKVRTLTRH